MEVQILSNTQDALTVISMCARTCYKSREKDPIAQYIKKLASKMGEGKVVSKEDSENWAEEALSKQQDFIKGLIKAGHETPLENAVVTFDIKGVSRALLAQITRHRIATFCVESQRYVKYDGKWEEGKHYIIPPSIKNNQVAIGYFSTIINAANTNYTELIHECDIAPEDARMILPQCFLTNLTVTMNARELRHFFKLRLDKHAQWEIRLLANMMLDALISRGWGCLFEDVMEKLSESK